MTQTYAKSQHFEGPEISGFENNEPLPKPSESIERIRANMAGVFVGKPEIIQMVLTGLLADGHLLIEDVPGIGKTLLRGPWPAALAVASIGFNSRRTCCPAI